MPRDPTGTSDPPPPFDKDITNEPDPRAGRVPASRVPLRNGQNCAISPFQVDVRFSLGRGEGSKEAVVPPAGHEGQRVVIEHVTLAVSVPARQGIVAYVKIGEIQHALVLTAQKGWSNPRFRASQPMSLYSVGGGAGMAFAGVERSQTTGSASVYFTVSGYLMDPAERDS